MIPKVRAPKRRGKSATWHRSRLWAFERAGWRCEAQASDSCTGRAEHAHHILMRSQGGDDDQANLLATCGPCHGFIHNHPAISYERGWLRRSGIQEDR